MSIPAALLSVGSPDWDEPPEHAAAAVPNSVKVIHNRQFAHRSLSLSVRVPHMYHEGTMYQRVLA
jgi:hypothetical protein